MLTLKKGTDKRLAGLLELGTNLTLSETSDGLPLLDSTGGGASTLTDLTDVTISAPATGQYLRKSAGDWVNSALLHSDVTFSGLTAGHVWRASGASAASFAALQAGDLPSHTHPYTDLTFSGLTTGHVFQATGATTAGFAAIPSHTHAADAVTAGTFGTTGGLYQFTVTAGKLINTVSAGESPLQVYQATADADAFMTFHVSGDFAAYFGIDGSVNDFAVGGWSFGANAYRVWHQGNQSTLQSSLTILESQITDGSILARVAAAETISGTWSFTNGLIVGTDPTGSELLRVGSGGRFNGSLVAKGADLRGTTLGSDSNDVTLGHAGSPATNIPQFALSVRANDKELWLYGYDGTTFRNFWSGDYANNQFRVLTTFVVGTDPSGSGLARIGGAVSLTGGVEWMTSAVSRWAVGLSGAGGLQIQPTASASNTNTFWLDSSSGVQASLDNATGKFTAKSLIAGTDPTGSEALRVGGAARLNDYLMVTGTGKYILAQDATEAQYRLEKTGASPNLSYFYNNGTNVGLFDSTNGRSVWYYSISENTIRTANAIVTPNGSNGYYMGRNAANSANIALLGIDSGNNLNLGRDDGIGQIQLFGPTVWYDDAATPSSFFEIISTSIRPTVAGGMTLGVFTLPWSKAYLGSASTVDAGNLVIGGTSSHITLQDNSQAANSRVWVVDQNATTFRILAGNDAYNTFSVGMYIARTGTTIGSVQFPNGSLIVGADPGGSDLVRAGGSMTLAGNLTLTLATDPLVSLNATGGSGRTYRVISRSSDGSLVFRDNTGAADRMIIYTGGDVGIGTLGRFQSTVAPSPDQLLSYDSSISKWVPRTVQLQFASGNVVSGNLGDGTAAQYVNTNPTINGSQGGTPAQPTTQALYKAIIITMPTTLPANCVYVLDYSTNGGAYTTNAIITTSNKVVHSNLSLANNYNYKYLIRGAGDTAYSTPSGAVSPSQTAEVNAFGIILASQIATGTLSAITANMGTLTAGVIQDAAQKFKIDLNNRLITMIDEQASPVTRIRLGELNTGLADWGLEIKDQYNRTVLDANGLGLDARLFGQNRQLSQVMTFLIPNAEFDLWNGSTVLHWAVDTTGSASHAKESAPAQLVAQPENFGHASWTQFNSPTLTSGQADPFGGTAAYLLDDNSGAAVEYIATSVSLTNGTSASGCLFLRAGTATRTDFDILWTGSPDRTSVVVTWSAGVPSPAIGSGTGSVTATNFGNGWYIIELSGVPVTGTGSQFRIFPAGDVTANTGTVYIFGANCWNVSTPGIYNNGATGKLPVFSGDFCLKYINPDTTTNSGWHGISTNDSFKGAFCVPMRPGQIYQLRVATRCDQFGAGQQYRIRISHNAAETVTSTKTFTYRAVNAWQVDHWAITVPATAESNSKVYIEFNRSGVTTHTTFSIDSLRLVEVEEAQFYDNGDSGSAKTIDWAYGPTQRLRLTSGCTLTFANGRPGQTYTLEVQQDGTGSRTITHDPKVYTPSDGALTLTSTANKVTFLAFECVYLPGTTDVVYFGRVLASDYTQNDFRSAQGSLSWTTGQTLGTDIVVTGLGFAPKCVIFWTAGRSGTTDSVGSARSYKSFGVMVSGHSACVATHQTDNVATSQSDSICADSGLGTAAVVYEVQNAAATGRLDMVSLNSDGFTIEVGDVAAENHEVFWWALGGNTFTCSLVQTFVPTSTGTGNPITHALGSTPAGGILFGTNNTCAVGEPTVDTTVADSVMGIGMFAGSNVYAISGLEQDGVTAPRSFSYGRQELYNLKYSTTSTLQIRSSLSSVSSTQVTPNWLEVWTGGATQKPLWLLTFGGCRAAVEGGNTLTNTTADINFPAAGTATVLPRAAFFLSHNRAASASDTHDADMQFSLGFAVQPVSGGTPTQMCGVSSSRDFAAPANSQAQTGHYFDSVYANLAVATDALEGRMRCTGMAYGKVTCRMDDADPVAARVGCLMIGN